MSVKQIGVWVTAWLLSAVSLSADAPLADAAQIMDWEGIRALLEEPAEVNASAGGRDDGPALGRPPR